MATTRRSFLQMALAPAALAMLDSNKILGAPAIIKPELTPQQFGATGGDPVADTLGWNRAMAAAAESRRPIMAKGTYVLRVPAKSTWNWWNRPEHQTHVAVQLRSGVQVYGNKADILIGAPERPPVGKEHHFIFGTELNMKPGTLQDVRFEGLNIDFREEFGTIHRPTYAFAIVGVDNFERHNLVIRSSGAMGGRGLLSENVRNRVDRGLKLLNLEQGIYTHYEYGVTMENIEMDHFNEGFDFEGPAWDVNLSHLKFRNGHREAQCIDTGGGARWMISDVDAEDTGAIAFIYNKSISWPTYEQWYNAIDNKDHEFVTPDFVIPEKMTIRGVRGRNVGRGLDKGKGAGKEEVLRVGSYRALGTHNSFPGHTVRSPRDITIEDWTLDNTYRIGVADCENLTMRNITMNNVKTPDDSQVGAALVLREADATLGGSVTGVVSDIRISGCEGMGISVVAGPGLKIQRVTIENFDSKGGTATKTAIRIRHRKNGGPELAQIEGVSAKGGWDGDTVTDIVDTEPLESAAELRKERKASRPRSFERKVEKNKKRGNPTKTPIYEKGNLEP